MFNSSVHGKGKAFKQWQKSLSHSHTGWPLSHPGTVFHNWLEWRPLLCYFISLFPLFLSPGCCLLPCFVHIFCCSHFMLYNYSPKKKLGMHALILLQCKPSLSGWLRSFSLAIIYFTTVLPWKPLHHVGRSPSAARKPADSRVNALWSQSLTNQQRNRT